MTALKLTEAQLQEKVIDLAKARGWKVHHDRGDYRKCIGGDPGFPDLVLARGGAVLFVELKSMTGSASARQLDWLDALGANTFIWRPSSWPTIESILSAKPGSEAL